MTNMSMYPETAVAIHTLILKYPPINPLICDF